MTQAALPAHHQEDAGDLSVSRGFLGHPVGLAYLSFAEAWERFAFYGMQSLLVLYMLDQLLKPGHVEKVAGFGLLKRLLSGGAAITDQALASAIYGLYLGLCYATPILGGLIADRLLGRTRTIVAGAIMLVAGHFLMTFDAPFLIALLLLVTGVGCVKANLSAQVGDLYAVDDLRRGDAFQIYVGMMQVAGIVAPIVCGALGELVGWHYGFGAAGIGMAIGLAIYLGWRRDLPPDPPRRRRSETRATMTADERRTTIVLLALLPVLGVMSVCNDQIYNAYMVWGERSYDRMFFGHAMPTSWLGSIDTIAAVAAAVIVIAFWRFWAKRRPDPDEITKVAIGGCLGICGTLVLVAASAWMGHGGKVSLWWAILFEAFDNLGFAMIYPISLALFSRAAPRPVVGLLMGCFFLHLTISNFLVGWVGGFLGTMPDTHFWLIHTAIAAAGTAGLFLFRALFHQRLAPEATGA
jgi:POT family proton-dependent oligopeptide transporter